MVEEDNERLFRRFVAAMNRGDQEEVLRVWSPEMVHHGRFGTYGRDEVTELMGGFRTAFPDLAFEIEELAADGDRLFVRMTATCTHQQDFQGVRATGRRVRVQVMGQVRIVDGKIVEHYNVMDELHFLNQLGLVPDDLLVTILA
ncbi:C-1 hydroxylase [Saccharopolyspora shandongensis]|uniref:C-1 hydroxylase n=1 Tax=Saccharopolyspora shandongensis TaxID=418495 RepID=A0A1H2QSU8_9PSEU|nr:ester cyclase [Saccharopolyspora shandongensis]SDW09724.1 C-1 hydroxylase [Saccharopolyspora shandongensis]